MDKFEEAILKAKMEECKNENEENELVKTAKDVRRAYYRNYYANHKEQYKRNMANYWIRKAEKNGNKIND